MRLLDRRTIIRAALALLALALAGCVGAAAPPAAPAPSPYAGPLDSIFADSSLAHAHWGVLVRPLAGGEPVYARNPEKAFVPASNLKLLTAAAALEALGPEHRFRTLVSAAGPVRDGVLQGPLVVRGSGDPTISGRYLEDARQVFRAWADSLRAHGVTRVAGGVVGVDSVFPGPPLGAGWSWDDLREPYAAEITGLPFNEGVIRLQVVPSRTEGQPAVVMFSPATQYVTLVNRTVTTPAGSPTRVSVTRDPSGPGLQVRGEVAADAGVVEETVAVRNPTLYFVTTLRETLREAGVQVEGQPLDASEWEAGELPISGAAPLFEHASPPLREILPAVLKESQNLIAETLLLTLGRELGAAGTAAAGAAVADSMFRAWGLPTAHLRMADGSGLSRYNLVTPELLVALLGHMAGSPYREAWEASLTVAGLDGTLENRMRGTPAEGRVRGKTGSMSAVRALSGYVDTAGGERLVFSVLVNHFVAPAATVDRVVDAALAALAAP